MQNVLKQPVALRPDWPGAVASFAARFPG